MVLQGHIQNGAIVLDGGKLPPEGTAVTIEVKTSPPTGTAKQFIDFPLVRSKHPGSVHLTGELIAELLDEPDVPGGR